MTGKPDEVRTLPECARGYDDTRKKWRTECAVFQEEHLTDAPPRTCPHCGFRFISAPSPRLRLSR